LIPDFVKSLPDIEEDRYATEYLLASILFILLTILYVYSICSLMCVYYKNQIDDQKSAYRSPLLWRSLEVS
jgi:hypothetical protein